MSRLNSEPLNSHHSISAVIPAYNNASTIVEALDSAAAQTCPVAEVIVIDDGSTDNTADVARACIKRCRLSGVVLTQQNGGPAVARNKGVEAAKGDWIAFLDADDAWMPWRLSVQCDVAAKHHEFDCWCGQAVRWGEPGQRYTEAQPSGNPSFMELTLDDFLTGNTVATSTVLVRRNCLVAVGGFDPAFRGPEDFDLWLRLAARWRMAYISESLARYRYRPGSLSLDDRTFLPQTLRVLDKAFGPGGALEGRQSDRSCAESTQYWNASWMAFVRGERMAAMSLCLRAWRLNRSGAKRVSRPWWRLLARYAVGKKPAGMTGGDRNE